MWNGGGSRAEVRLVPASPPCGVQNTERQNVSIYVNWNRALFSPKKSRQLSLKHARIFATALQQLTPFPPSVITSSSACVTRVSLSLFGLWGYAHGRQDGSIHVVLEYMDRGSLSDVIHGWRGMEYGEALIAAVTFQVRLIYSNHSLRSCSVGDIWLLLSLQYGHDQTTNPALGSFLLGAAVVHNTCLVWLVTFALIPSRHAAHYCCCRCFGDWGTSTTSTTYIETSNPKTSSSIGKGTPRNVCRGCPTSIACVRFLSRYCCASSMYKRFGFRRRCCKRKMCAP